MSKANQALTMQPLIEKILSFFSTPVQAGCNPGTNDFKLFDCLMLNSSETVKDTYDTPATLVNTIVQNVFLAAGIILFLMVIFAGFKFAMSGKAAGKEGAKDTIKAVAIGFLVLFCSYWIIQIVEAVTGIPNII